MRSSTKKGKVSADTEGNRLFPVFVKLESLSVLIVGGGKVAGEKLGAILSNSPSTLIRIISKSFTPAIRRAARSTITLITKDFEPEDLNGIDLVFSAVNDLETSKAISAAARKRRILHNAADKPDLCDFYLGSIVHKGNLKLGISTNGKSPTMAKRLKAILQESIPDDIDQTLINMAAIRNSLKGSLRQKASQLNAITSILVGEHSKVSKTKRPVRKRR